MKVRFLKCWLVILTWFLSLGVVGQNFNKKILERDTYKTWELIQDYNISNDGKYFWYFYGSQQTGNTLVVADVNGNSTIKYSGAIDPQFTNDSRYVLFKMSSDTLVICDLINKRCKNIPDVFEAKLFGFGNRQWVVYKSIGGIYVREITTNKLYDFPNGEDFVVSQRGNAMVLKSISGLLLITFPDFRTRTLSNSSNIAKMIFDDSGNHFAFISTSQNKKLSLYSLDIRNANSKLLAEDGMLSSDVLLTDQLLKFSKDGNLIYFKTKKKVPDAKKDRLFFAENLIVWNYKDRVLKHQEHSLQSPARSFLNVISVKAGKIIPLENDSLEVFSGGVGNNTYLVVRNLSSYDEAYWNSREKPDYQIVSLENGNLAKFGNPFEPNISPSEKYITWYDTVTKNIICYDIAKRSTKSATKGIVVPNDLVFQTSEMPSARFYNYIAGWLPNDESFLVRDKYDIWQIDPLSKRQPLNLTGGFGRENKIQFDLAEPAWQQCVNIEKPGLLLRALNETNKNNGFAVVEIGSDKGLKMHRVDPYLYSWSMIDEPPKIKKARDAQVYLVSRQTANEVPNVFVSHDLESFRQLSKIQPQIDYNWLTSELITWTTYNGEINKGILYKPENFDSSKRYPIIFNFYQEKSFELHKCPMPGRAGMELEIPEYVSSGYIVFVPDIINDKIGEIANTTINVVASAAKYLIQKYSWINEKRMGLQGHSFGGYEVNLLVANSTMFAAASSSAGLSDLVSQFGGIGFEGRSLNRITEIGQNNLGTQPWKSPDVYLRNSPLFKVDKVVTPILIKHGNIDDCVPFAQAIEWFTALRRLKRPAWFLEYDNEKHFMGLHSMAALDFSVRQRQFFDHYLKGELAPFWMTIGVDERFRKIRSGLELDRYGKCSEKCPVCNSINKFGQFSENRYFN